MLGLVSPHKSTNLIQWIHEGSEPSIVDILFFLLFRLREFTWLYSDFLLCVPTLTNSCFMKKIRAWFDFQFGNLSANDKWILTIWKALRVKQILFFLIVTWRMLKFSYPLRNLLPVLRWHKFCIRHNLKVAGFGQVVTSKNIGLWWLIVEKK